MRVIILVATLLACAGNAMHAQSKRPNDRKGFWVGFGLAAGSAGVDCSSCSDERIGGTAGYIRLGGTLSRHFLLGFETNGWLHSQDNVDESIAFASAVLLWYPSAQGALYLKFGLGGMAYSSDDGVDELTATAPSASIGVGYEIRVGRNVSLVPYLNSSASSSVDVEINGVSYGSIDLSLSVVEFGLGITWH